MTAIVIHFPWLTGNVAECKGYLNQYGQLAPILTPVDWLSCGGDEYLVGRAGYLAGLLWLREETGLEVYRIQYNFFL